MNGKRIPKRDARRHHAIVEVAARHLNLDTLDERGSDRLDFHELSVGSIRDALEAAYAAGAASVAEGGARMSGNITQGIDRDLAEQLQTFDTRFLLAIHHGDVDVATLVRRELMNRCLNGDGRWVGFAKAGELLGV